jgi:hypothetical protein
MSLQGSLSDINLADILQLIATSRKTGRFKLERKGSVGYIYFDKGQLVHAELGDENLRGESAVYRLSAWKDGTFEFQANEKTPEISIKRAFPTVIMEAVRIIDEWELIRKKISSEDMVPLFKNMETDQKRRITLNTKEWLILSKIDGIKTIKSIAYDTGLSIFEAAKIFYGLLVNDLIELKRRDG